MSMQDTEVKARLMAKAEASIDAMLAARQRPSEAQLEDIEQAALTAGQRLAHAVTVELVAESAAELPVWPMCPTCGQKMKAKGKRRRRMVTESGEVTLKRTYYHCAACGQGIFPPG